MKNRFNTINAKLILLISSILCVTILVIFFSTLWILNGFQRKNVAQALERTELLVNTLITAKLQELKVQSQLVGELPILNTAVENGEVNTIRDIGRTYRDNLNAPILDILDREGSVIASINGNLGKEDTLAASLAQRILDEGNLCTVFSRGGNLVLIGGAAIGTSEDASGVLLVGTELDTNFARQVRDFTKSEISFLVGGKIRGSSLPLEEQNQLASTSTSYAGADKYATRRLVLKDKDGNVLGEAVIQMPLEEHRTMLAILKRSLAGIGAFVFLLAWAVAFRFSTGFTRPIADAVNFAQKLATGDHNTSIEVNRSDELGSLQESLEKMRVALKEHIENLDAKVKDGIRHVTNILDNLDSGFLIFDRKGVVRPGYSRISEDFFGQALAGKKIEEILRIEPEIWQNIEAWRDILFGNVLSFKDAVPLGPSSFEKIEGKYIELSYRPINPGTGLEGVILIATDKTFERELYRRFELEKERVEMIIKITTNREAFLDFVKEAKGFINSIQKELNAKDGPGADLDSALRTMHTLKGNSAMYSCTRVKEIAHTLEADLIDLRGKNGDGFEQYLPNLRAGLVALEEAVAKVLLDNRALIGDERLESADLRHVTVSDTLLTSLETALLQHFRRESMVYRMFMDNFVLEPVLPPLKKYEAVAHDLAERRQKMIKPITWEGKEVKARLGNYKKLLASMVHAFRNAVDHGIEEAEDREVAGKDPEGNIAVLVERAEDEVPLLRIRVRDDGKGISPAVIRGKIVEKGFLSEAEAAILDDREVIQFIFRNGFSTAEALTEVSGRGVGMDAIAYEAKKLGGHAWVDSEIGQWSQLTVEVPLLD